MPVFPAQLRGLGSRVDYRRGRQRMPYSVVSGPRSTTWNGQRNQMRIVVVADTAQVQERRWLECAGLIGCVKRDRMLVVGDALERRCPLVED